MKGYKIGINADLTDFVLIELDIPEAYPGFKIYKHKVTTIEDPCIVNYYRANVARVLNISKYNSGAAEYVDAAFSLYDENFYYHPGEIIYPDSFDPNPDAVCTSGIHFFDNAKDAINYKKDDWARYKYQCSIVSKIYEWAEGTKM